MLHSHLSLQLCKPMLQPQQKQIWAQLVTILVPVLSMTACPCVLLVTQLQTLLTHQTWTHSLQVRGRRLLTQVCLLGSLQAGLVLAQHLWLCQWQPVNLHAPPVLLLLVDNSNVLEGCAYTTLQIGRYLPPQALASLLINYLIKLSFALNHNCTGLGLLLSFCHCALAILGNA